MKRYNKIITAAYVFLVALAVFGCLNSVFVKIRPRGKIIALCQNPEWPTGCESVSLYILLNYYGVEASVRDIADALPRELLPWEENGTVYGGNPERGFVGSPSDSDSYGVFNGPIAAVANKFREGAVAESGLDVRDIEEILRERIPLIAWVSMYPEREPKISHWVDSETGEDVTWIGGEHAVVVYDRDGEDFKISDPKTGKLGLMSKNDLAVGFERHGGRVVYYPKE